MESGVSRESISLCELMGLGVKDRARLWVESDFELLEFERRRCCVLGLLMLIYIAYRRN